MSVPVSVTREGKELKVSVPAAKDGISGEVWICSIASAVPIAIGKGENRGPRNHLSQRGAQLAQGR